MSGTEKQKKETSVVTADIFSGITESEEVVYGLIKLL